MAQLLRALATLSEILDSRPQTCMEVTTICHSSFRKFDALFWYSWALHTCAAQTCRQNTHIQKTIK